MIRPVVRLPARQLRLRNGGRGSLDVFIDSQFERGSDVGMQRVGRQDNDVFDGAELSETGRKLRNEQHMLIASGCDLNASVAASEAWLSISTGMTQAQFGGQTSKQSTRASPSAGGMEDAMCARGQTTCNAALKKASLLSDAMVSCLDMDRGGWGTWHVYMRGERRRAGSVRGTRRCCQSPRPLII